ncbi:MAG: bifunctional folylpolyglutamate synthase/dihydrofolate synthase [Erythrobacter sp.]|nr:bifunctional folylpolyglutamate synthase/dihydrofolate synthase [Erythrobacter sp.]
MDFGRSDHPGVQSQLDRLADLSVPDGRLGLDTIRDVLARLGDPHLHLPPVFHVAGTNGKGSVCAFLRAMLEADGKSVHVTTSPHLVRYNERIRVAGKLVSDEELEALLQEVLDASIGQGPSFFEVTIAAAFLAFSRTPADACVVEVGLGGRFDATNVLKQPAVCGIAALGIDHERFLLAPERGAPDDPISRIAFEKAGIAKPGSPLVTLDYDEGPTLEIERAVLRVGTALKMRGREWHASLDVAGLHYADFDGALELPTPALPGAHQALNAALAVAMLRHQQQISISREAMAEGIRSARWPARLQRLSDGPLAAKREVWLDGGHNPSAGEILARHFAGQRVHLVLGMLDNKNPDALLGPLQGNVASLTVVPVPGHPCHQLEAFGSNGVAAHDVPEALAALPEDQLPVLITGSLYLAGEVLRLNNELPD